MDIAAGGGAFAVVQGDALTGQGLYVVGPHSAAVITEAITTPDVTNPRIDIAVLEVFDNTLDASGLNIAQVRIIAGTPTAGTTLDSRAGVAALPGSALLLADILVTANAVSVSNTQIRDRRKWARGAYVRVERNTGDYSTTSVSAVEVDSVNIRTRVECSGVPLRATISGTVQNTVAGNKTTIGPTVNGVFLRASAAPVIAVVSGADGYITNSYITTLAAGTYLFSVFWNVSAGTSLLRASNGGNGAFEFTIEELVRQNRGNNVTTSG